MDEFKNMNSSLMYYKRNEDIIFVAFPAESRRTLQLFPIPPAIVIVLARIRSTATHIFALDAHRDVEQR